MLQPTGRPTSPTGLGASSPENPQPPQDGQNVTLGNGRRVSVSSAPPHSPDPYDDLGEFFGMAEQSGGHGQNPQEVLQGAAGGEPPEQQNETQWGIRPDHHGHHHHRHAPRGHHSHHHRSHQPNPEELIIVETADGQKQLMTEEQFQRKFDPDGTSKARIEFIYKKDSHGYMHAIEESLFKAENAGSNITETG